jgi:hypothetical protein
LLRGRTSVHQVEGFAAISTSSAEANNAALIQINLGRGRLPHIGIYQ